MTNGVGIEGNVSASLGFHTGFCTLSNPKDRRFSVNALLFGRGGLQIFKRRLRWSTPYCIPRYTYYVPITTTYSMTFQFNTCKLAQPAIQKPGG